MYICPFALSIIMYMRKDHPADRNASRSRKEKRIHYQEPTYENAIIFFIKIMVVQNKIIRFVLKYIFYTLIEGLRPCPAPCSETLAGCENVSCPYDRSFLQYDAPSFPQFPEPLLRHIAKRVPPSYRQHRVCLGVWMWRWY